MDDSKGETQKESMRFSLLWMFSLILVLGIGLLISGASLADRGDDDKRRARAEILVVGFFGCGDFQQGDPEPRRESNAGWGFIGWEGVGEAGDDPKTEPFEFRLEARGDLGENCRGMTQEVRSVARALGCATGPMHVREDAEVAFEQSFPFTCSGRRDQVVGAMAELSAAILEFPR